MKFIKKFVVILLTTLMLFTLFQEASRENIVKASLGEWIEINKGLYGKVILSLAIDSKNTQAIYTGTDAGIFKSADGGISWFAINTGLTSTSVRSLAIDSTNTNTIYAGTFNKGVFKSADGGISWFAINSGLTSTWINSLVIDPANTQIIYAGTGDKGVFKSTDGGYSWKQDGLSTRIIGSLAIDPTNTQVIYAGTTVSGVFKSIDGGSSWTEINNGLTLVKITFTVVNSLAINPTNTQVIYAGMRGGLFKSTDGGSSWSGTGFAGGEIYSLVIDPKNTQTIYIGTSDGDVLKSADGGSSWTGWTWTEWTEWTGPGLAGSKIYSLAIDPKNTQTIYAGTDGIGLYKYICLVYTVNALASAGGFISPSGIITVNYGDSKTFNITPNQGYKILSVVIDGNSIGAVTSCTFSNINSDHTISVEFILSDINPPTITLFSPTDGSTVSTQTVNISGKVTDNVEVVSVWVGGKKAEIAPDGTFSTTISLDEGINAIKVVALDAAGNKGENVLNVTYKKKIAIIIVLQIGNYDFTVNGETRTLDSPAIIKNSRTLLPIRAIVEALGGTIEWIPTTKSITIKLGSTYIGMQIGNSTAVVNGNVMNIDSDNPKVVPEIINSRTMLPLRFVTEKLGCDVQWDGTTKTITITYTKK
jgi:photosystem II stability/assembly factor-like uncharacterized protein